MAPKARKAKTLEPSLRDKLSANFLRAIADDFAANGIEAIKELRERSPEKYCEISARLIAAIEPKPDLAGFESANSMQEIAIRLLQSVGRAESEITADMIEQAIELNNEFVAGLELIRAKALGEEIH